jgi:predicted N-acetyltransferase YhbS
VARELGFRSALLVGYPAYYLRFGYRSAETFGIVTGLELPADVFMACELTEGGLDGVQGQVEFAPEFNLEPAES